MVEHVVLRTGQARDQLISKRDEVGVSHLCHCRLKDEATGAAVQQAHFFRSASSFRYSGSVRSKPAVPGRY